MFKVNFRFLFLILTLILFSTYSYSQTKEEEELIKTGEKHFENGEFTDAVTIYGQLIGANAQSAEYNYRYGACLLYTSKKKSEALSYLKFAVKNLSDVTEAHYYLGRAYHISYQFSQAITYYKQFKASVKPKKAKEYKLDLLISECQRAQVIIKDFKQVKVIKSKSLKKSQFFRGYKLGKLNRKILVKPDEFKTKEDDEVEHKELSLVVHGPDQETLIFSGYIKNSTTGDFNKDLYSVSKDEDGTWSSYESLGAVINTDFDEEYPYLHPNGKILYFSSKGHGGIGGYDIYKSEKYGGEWGTPVNVGFSINSPFDDILYVVDQNENAAFFSSDRQNGMGDITVYKIIPPKNNDNFILVKGDVIIEGEKTKKTVITIVNSKTGEFVGKYKSDKKTGQFVFPLAENETYKVKFSFLDTLNAVVELVMPAKKDKEIIYQEIVLNSGNAAKIKENLAYQASDNERSELIRKMASLGKNQVKDVSFSPEVPVKKEQRDLAGNSNDNNSSETDPRATMDVVENAESSELGDEPVDLLSKAELELEDLRNENLKVSKQISASYRVAEEKNNNAARLKDELIELGVGAVGSAESNESDAVAVKKQELNKELNGAAMALKFAKELEEGSEAKQKEESLTATYVEALSAVSNSGSTSESIEKLESYQKGMEQLKGEASNSDTGSSVDETKRSLSQNKNEKRSVSSKVNEIKSELNLMDKEKALITGQIEDTRKKSVKEELGLQLEELALDKKKKEAELVENETKLTTIRNQVTKEKFELAIYDEIEKGAESSEEVPLTDAEKKAVIADVSNNVAEVGVMANLDVIAASDQLNSGNNTSVNNNENLIDKDNNDVAADVSSAVNVEGKNTGNNTANNNNTSDHDELAFSDTSVDHEFSTELISTDMQSVGNDQIESLGEKVFDFPSPVDNQTASKSITQNEASATEKIRKALVVQKLVEEKKTEYRQVISEDERKSLEDEIMLLENQVQGLKSDATLKRQYANKERYNKKKEDLDFEVFVDPELDNSTAIRQKKLEVDNLWEKAASIESIKKSSTIAKKKDELGTEQLIVETAAIEKQLELEDLIKKEKGLRASSEKSNTENVAVATTTEGENSDNVDEAISGAEVSDVSTDNSDNVDEAISGAEVSDVSTDNSDNVDEAVSGAEVSDVSTDNSGTTETNVSDVEGNSVASDKVASTEFAETAGDNLSTNKNTSKDINSSADAGDLTVSETTKKEQLKREEYNNKAESLVNKALQASDPYEQQKLFEEASLYELAGDEQKLIEFNYDAQEGFTAYEENTEFVSEAKKNMNKNSLSADAFRLEEKSASLYLKAQSKLNEASAESDPIEKINKTNEAKEMIAYSRLKQKEALKKYRDSARKPENPLYADNDFKIDAVSIADGRLKSDDVVASNSGNVNEETEQGNETNINDVEDKFIDINANNNSAISVEGAVRDSDENGNSSNNISAQLVGSKSDYLLAYEILIRDAQKIEAEEEQRVAKIEELKFLAQTNKDKSENALKEVQYLSNDEGKAQKLQEANAFREQAEAREVAYKNEEYYMANNLTEAKSKRDEAQLILDVLSDSERDEALAINKGGITYPIYDFDDNKGTYSPSTMTVKEGFKVIATARYTSRTVIPVDVSLPTGLLYKVQVGAFENKINPAIFNGISPLSGEKTNTGIIRYTAGLFKSFHAADMAKGRIRNLGYSDAFVVAFFDGRRISMEDADDKRSNASDDDKEDYNLNQDKEVKALKKLGITEDEADSKGGKRVNPIDNFASSSNRSTTSTS
ncbi:MAG: hypothetical protein ACJAZ2_000347, partial [Glaciecola sp.]